MIIDTHAHLYYENIAVNLDEVLENARNSSVQKIIVPAVDLKTSCEIIKLSEKHDIIHALVGIHPGDVNNSNPDDLSEIERLLEHPKVVGIGETGLDYYWDTSNIDTQKVFFQSQIEMAKKNKLPIVIHTRNSTEDAITMIEENYDEDLSGQFHCFGGSAADAEKILRLDNFYISFCGNVTYKSYKEYDVIESIPAERLLSETDSPFLTPVPYRGKVNEPANIIHTIRKIAQVKEMDEAELLRIMYENSFKLFAKIKENRF
jgi:TatD DNase family protein